MSVEVKHMYTKNKVMICNPKNLQQAVDYAVNIHKCVKCVRNKHLVYVHYPDYYITMECGDIYRLRALNPLNVR